MSRRRGSLLLGGTFGDGRVRWAFTGLSLLEVLVAALLLVVIVAAVAGLLSVAATYAEIGKRGTDAASVAAAEVERLRNMPYRDLEEVPSETFEVVFGDVPYQVTRTVEPDQPAPNMTRVTVEVGYDLRGPRVYRTQVIFTDLMRPPVTPSP